MTSQRWNNTLLDSMRQRGDSVADEVISILFQQGSIDLVNELMTDLVHNDTLPPNRMPAAVRDYFNSTDRLPPWADEALIAQGEALFGRYGMQIIMILGCSSLPHCYAARKGVQVLYATASLRDDLHRRVAETAQMIFDVMGPGGLAPGHGTGIRSAQKVRLMHSAIRYLLTNSGRWARGAYDLPVNQEDMAGTLLTFSLIPLQGLRAMGSDFTEAEEHAYLHAWNVVGHLLGVDDAMLAHNMREAEALWAMIKRRQFAASEAGQRMTAALIEWMKYMIPGNFFDNFPVTMMRFFVASEVCDMLGVPPADWTATLLNPMRRLSIFTDESGDRLPALARAAEVFSRKLLEGLLWFDRGGRANFQISESLRRQWNIMV